jgi:hypothetical protein
LLLEHVLASYDLAKGLRFVTLHYFNAAGATESHGEHHDPETHLIPNVLLTATGAKSHFFSYAGICEQGGVGIVQCNDRAKIGDCFKQADKAAIESKDKGRGQVTLRG